MDRLVICLISGLDVRRINPEDTPYLNRALNMYPWVGIKTIPNSDLLSTILTGAYPHQHGIWEIKFTDSQLNTSVERPFDKIPDILTTTFQCLIHFITGSFDLAAVPPYRRKQFEIRKTKYFKRNVTQFLSLNEIETIFGVIGEKDSNFIYVSSLKKLYSILPSLCSLKYRLELLYIHSLDIIQHWGLDNPNRIRKFYSDIDGFVENLNIKCSDKNTTMMVITDHGQEPVRGSIDIIKALKRSGLPRDEFSYYIEATKARFYFHTDRAREIILTLLSSIQKGAVLSYKDMHEYNIKFEDKSYGEYYLILDPGYIFFPNDFYHPLGNIFLGLTDWQQRSRLLSPKYRGNHAYLPHNESEKGSMMLLNESYKVIKKGAEIIDIAPTVLKLLGYKKPDFMKGQCIFT